MRYLHRRCNLALQQRGVLNRDQKSQFSSLGLRQDVETVVFWNPEAQRSVASGACDIQFSANLLKIHFEAHDVVERVPMPTERAEFFP